MLEIDSPPSTLNERSPQNGENTPAVLSQRAREVCEALAHIFPVVPARYLRYQDLFGSPYLNSCKENLTIIQDETNLPKVNNP